MLERGRVDRGRASRGSAVGQANVGYQAVHGWPVSTTGPEQMGSLRRL